MIKMILLIWVVLASIFVILWGLWEMGKKIIKRLFKPPKKSRPEDDDNSWLNNQHFDMH